MFYLKIKKITLKIIVKFQIVCLVTCIHLIFLQKLTAEGIFNN